MYLNIRGKLTLLLGLVLLMDLMLFFGAIWGLVSYRETIDQFNLAINKFPHQIDLVQAVADLAFPLMDDLPGTSPSEGEKKFFPASQKMKFLAALQNSQDRLLKYQTELDRFSDRESNAGISYAISGPLMKIQAGTDYLEGLAKEIDSPDLKTRLSTLKVMRWTITDLLRSACNVPDSIQGLNRDLNHARNVHHSLIYVIWISGASCLLIFLGLIRYAYRTLYVPVRKLYEGSRRVANEDFDFRVQINSSDEMGEFATAFNTMIARFQEIKNDLDQQVRERSKQLVRSERLAGVGFLAAGVAHEINNPLSAIVMAADSLEDRLSSISPHLDQENHAIFEQYLKMIQRESDRCRKITGRLLDFARGQDATRSRTNLTAIIQEVLEMISHLSKFRERHIVFDYKQPCYVVVNGAEIKQVMLNLTANALEAMPTGGTLTINIRELTDQVEITFQDDGCGMTQEVIDNLFEPFFTQKQEGQGTGLGLSISHRIIDEHQGTIEPKSDGPGKGSTFLVKLPRRSAQQSAA